MDTISSQPQEEEINAESFINLKEEDTSKDDLDKARKEAEELKEALRQQEERNKELFALVSKKNREDRRRNSYDDEDEPSQKKPSKSEEEATKFAAFYEAKRIEEFIKENEKDIELLRKADPTSYKSIELAMKADPREAINLLKNRIDAIKVLRLKKSAPQPFTGNNNSSSVFNNSQPQEKKLATYLDAKVAVNSPEEAEVVSQMIEEFRLRQARG